MTRAVARGLLLLHDNPRVGHAGNLMPGWNRDIPEPAWRWCGLGGFHRARGCRGHLGWSQRKFGCGLGRRLRARYNQRTAKQEDDRATHSEPAKTFHIRPPLRYRRCALSAPASRAWPSLTDHYG